MFLNKFLNYLPSRLSESYSTIKNPPWKSKQPAFLSLIGHLLGVFGAFERDDALWQSSEFVCCTGLNLANLLLSEGNKGIQSLKYEQTSQVVYYCSRLNSAGETDMTHGLVNSLLGRQPAFVAHVARSKHRKITT